jgi:mannose-6-phosphate isomerase-like protein (cupin superfamily)
MTDIICIKVADTETINRPYGFLYMLTPKVAKLERVHVQKISVNPRGLTSKHYHPMEEIFFILSGSGILKTADIEFTIEKNFVVLIPPNEVHQLINNSNFDALDYLVIMSPPWNPKKVIYINENNSISDTLTSDLTS